MGVWLPAVLVFLAAVFGTLSLALVWEALRDSMRRSRTRRRLSRVVGENIDAGEGRQIIKDSEAEGGLATALGRALPQLTGLRLLLQQAKLELSVESFIVVSIATAFGTVAAAILLGMPPILAALLGAPGAAMPYLWVARRRTKRLRAFEEQLPEAIDLLTRAIRAGHPITSGMRMVADEAPAIVADEFRQTFEEQRFGLPFEDAILNMVDRISSVDVRIFATALLIQREVGGNLAEILDNLANTIRGRFYIRRQLRVYTAQGRLTGWILGLLPIVVAGAIFLINDEYLDVLVNTTGGLFLLGSAVILQLAGVLWIRAIINIEI